MTPDVHAQQNTCDPQAAAELLRALAHPMRLTILCRLLDGEMPVSGFESELGLKQPNLSQQLGLLREAGLVTTRREAKSVFYCLADARLRIVLDALRGFLSGQSPLPQISTRISAPGNESGRFAVAGWPAPQRRGGAHG